MLGSVNAGFALFGEEWAGRGANEVMEAGSGERFWVMGWESFERARDGHGGGEMGWSIRPGESPLLFASASGSAQVHWFTVCCLL